LRLNIKDKREENHLEKTLQMRVEASHALNFLVYLQNAFFNKQFTDPMLIKFPYNSWNNEFHSNSIFNKAYKEIWNEVNVKIAENPLNDLQIFQNKEWFYDKLFQPSKPGLFVFNELYESFKAWWGSFAGQNTLEWSIDNEKHREIYSHLSKVFIEKKTEPQKVFNISLVYDDFPLGELEVMPYYAVVSLKEFHIHREKLLIKLGKCV
jgi:hypothetical protein